MKFEINEHLIKLVAAEIYADNVQGDAASYDIARASVRYNYTGLDAELGDAVIEKPDASLRFGTRVVIMFWVIYEKTVYAEVNQQGRIIDKLLIEL